jgi:hypothetical protein
MVKSQTLWRSFCDRNDQVDKREALGLYVGDLLGVMCLRTNELTCAMFDALHNLVNV